jgi:hypothetical protein
LVSLYFFLNMFDWIAVFALAQLFGVADCELTSIARFVAIIHMLLYTCVCCSTGSVLAREAHVEVCMVALYVGARVSATTDRTALLRRYSSDV